MDIVFIALEFGASELAGATGYDLLKTVVLFVCTAFVCALE